MHSSHHFNLIDWRTLRQKQQQWFGVSLIILSSVAIIFIGCLVHWRINSNNASLKQQTNQLATLPTACKLRTIQQLQLQLSQLKQQQAQWQMTTNRHNQRARVLQLAMANTSRRLQMQRIIFTPEQWLLDGFASDTHQYQQLLKQLNQSHLNIAFRLGHINHKSEHLYTFQLIGKKHEQMA